MCRWEARNAEAKTGNGRRVMQHFVGLIDPTRVILRVFRGFSRRARARDLALDTNSETSR